MRFSQDFIDKVKEAYTVYDVISPFVTLQRKGRAYWGCCPFHNEKTPSFTVDDTRGTYKCFGCGKGGNAITFLMEYKSLTFVEAVTYMAERAHIALPVEDSDPEAEKRRKEKEWGYNCLLETARFYRDRLLSGDYPEPVVYLEKRGISTDTLRLFGFGYSPDYYSLINYLKEKGFSENTMLYCGVASKNDKGVFDSLAKRLIVPIINAQGKVIGFGGRVLQKAVMAKYKNTGATPIFVKRDNLFGMNLFVKQKTREAIIVEGYFDLISLYQAGIKNAIAPMGTALTEKQCDILKRYDIQKVYVCFDGDSAGEHATLRSLDMLASRGLEVVIVSIPDDMDPDDAVNKLGVDGFRELLDKAKPLIDYRLYLTEQKYKPHDFDSRAKYTREAMQVLASLDAVSAGIYVDRVAELSGLDRSVILKDIGAQSSTATVVSSASQPQPTKVVAVADSGVLKAGRILLLAMIEGDYLDVLGCDECMFASEEQAKIFEYVSACVKDGKKPSLSYLYDAFADSVEMKELPQSLDNVDARTRKQLIAESVQLLFNNLKNNRLKELSAAYKTAKNDGERLEIKQKMSKILNILNERTKKE